MLCNALTIMSKKIISFVLIALAIIGYLTIGSPIEKTDDSKSIVKKASENIKQETMQEITKNTIEPISQQTIQSSCSGPNTTFCSTAQSYVFLTSLAVAVLFIAITTGGIITLIKVISSIF